MPPRRGWPSTARSHELPRRERSAGASGAGQELRHARPAAADRLGEPGEHRVAALDGAGGEATGKRAARLRRRAGADDRHRAPVIVDQGALREQQRWRVVLEPQTGLGEGLAWGPALRRGRAVDADRRTPDVVRGSAILHPWIPANRSWSGPKASPRN